MVICQMCGKGKKVNKESGSKLPVKEAKDYLSNKCKSGNCMFMIRK